MLKTPITLDSTPVNPKITSRRVHWLDFIFFLAAILSSCVKWNGQTIEQVTNDYPLSITPNTFTLVIWVLIYSLVVAFCVWELFPSSQKNECVGKVAWWLVAASIMQGLWLPAMGYEKMPLATIIMAIVFFCLLMLNIRTRSAPTVFRFPFTLWNGWVLVMLLVNFSVTMNYTYDIAFFANDLWTISALFFMGLCACVFSIAFMDAGFPVAIAWAVVGIHVANSEQNIRSCSFIVLLVVTSFMCTALAASYLNRKYVKKGETESLLPREMPERINIEIIPTSIAVHKEIDGENISPLSINSEIVNDTQEYPKSQVPYSGVVAQDQFYYQQYQSSPVMVPYDYQPAPPSQNNNTPFIGTPRPY